MFLGEFTHNIDDKGRLTIPARFRGELAAGLVVTRGFDHNLMVYPKDEWEPVAEKIKGMPLTNPRARRLRWRIFSQAANLTPDRQGRILLPQELRDAVGIEGEAVIVGMYNYVEIWSVPAWDEVREIIENEDDAEQWADLPL